MSILYSSVASIRLTFFRPFRPGYLRSFGSGDRIEDTPSSGATSPPLWWARPASDSTCCVSLAQRLPRFDTASTRGRPKPGREHA